MSKRYSLLVKSLGKNSIINIREYDKKLEKVVEKEKVDLSTIDLFTSCFSDEQELKSYLQISKDSILKIIYTSKGEIKELPLVFGDNDMMRHFSVMAYPNASIGEEGQKDTVFRYVLNHIFCFMCHRSIQEAIFRDYKINLHIKNKIKDYLEFNQDEAFVLKKIEEELLNYKNLRSMVLCLQAYEKKTGIKLFNVNIPVYDEIIAPENNELSRFIPEEGNEEPLFPPNSEEEKMYLDYMEDLMKDKDKIKTKRK